MSDALRTFNPRGNPAAGGTPQSEKAAKGQKRNAAGGYTFTVSDLDVARRFLILGSESGYYKSGEDKTAFNGTNLIKLAESEHSRELTDLIVDISTGGRAPKQQPALFALAIASSYGKAEDRAYALSKLSAVARTGSALFNFMEYVLQFRKYSTQLVKAVARWYESKDVAKLAYQLVKYQQREGWDHSRIVRISHPKGDEDFNGLMRWVLRGDTENVPTLVQGFIKAKDAKLTDAQLISLVKDFGLSWEMLPSERRNKAVWEGLLKSGNIPLGALLRQLATLSRLDVLKPMSEAEQLVVARFNDEEGIKRARLHPISILIAMRTYESGRSERGTSTWTPNRKVLDALDAAFYKAFTTVEPVGKRFLLALDVSGSMGTAVYGSSLTSREATAAVSLVIAATEPFTHTIGFTGGKTGGYGYHRRSATPAGNGTYASSVSELNISPRQRLTDAVSEVSGLPFGTTDCSLPMLYALERGLEIDTFIVMTDNETWAGNIHPHEALKRYRQATGIDAKLIVLATEASRSTIADPKDPGMLDIVGFDSAVPQLIAEFSKGL